MLAVAVIMLKVATEAENWSFTVYFHKLIITKKKEKKLNCKTELQNIF